MTVLVGILALTACETEEELQQWEDALAAAEARQEHVELDGRDAYSDAEPMSCEERLKLFASGDVSLHGERMDGGALAAKGDLACGQQNDVYTNETDRRRTCTIEYENECGSSYITGGTKGSSRLSTTQNGGTADIDIDVEPNATLTFHCNGSGGFEEDSKCSYKSTCKDAPQKKPSEVVGDY